eukprot:CAMPEP_0118934204 /NCGR_PEP_ID=MMETSP1169-20130426/13696_1 /TAXON_ID=36882 /ORGANISM="Pyramimonas obovata, Strain CCMP722" /LENGTH=283 /DNA_ID=CAMNT_0006877081 /DNA_START=191 /DNA_END=1042 /DNA_ORIENTATION=-
MAAAKEVSKNKMYGGFNKRFSHDSACLSCEMKFTVYLPPTASESAKVPVVYYLSGLTCTDENVIQKSNVQRKAAELGIAVVCPDTSPRGHGVEGEADSYDFGVGAGFYLNATVEKWKHWRMYEYVTAELPKVLAGAVPELDLSKQSIMGHSMGGHGALTVGLKNPTAYKSISAFSPIVNPVNVPWGKKAFTGYLGEDEATWKEYDACELIKAFKGDKLPILVDQGTSDNFLAEQLKPELLEEAAAAAGYPVTIRMQEGYDHSYFFIASFMDDHLEFHAKSLKA